MTQQQTLKKLKRLSKWTKELLDCSVFGEQYERELVTLRQCNNVECLLLSARGAAQREAVKNLHKTVCDTIAEYVI